MFKGPEMTEYQKPLHETIDLLRSIYEEGSEADFERFGPLTKGKPSCVFTCTNLDLLENDDLNP